MTKKRTTRARKNLGDSGERVAALFLQEHGYRVLARKVRTRFGEIDLIAEDADGLAFVEVRTRRGYTAGAPEESLTTRKRHRLMALAQAFLGTHPQYADCPWRIDFFGIQIDRDGHIERMELIKSAVEE